MAFALIQLYLLLVPGFLLTALLGIRRHQLLFSITFSLAVLIVLVSLARNYYWSVGQLAVAFLMLPLALLGILLTLYRQGLRIQREAFADFTRRRDLLTGYLVVGGGFLLWYLVGGPYTEVPADLYRHLEFARYQFEFILSGSLGPPLSLTQLATQHGGFWYVLIGLSADLSNTALIDTLYPVMLIGGLLFVLGTCQFSLALFAPLELSSRQTVLAAMLTSVFVCLQMGVSAFSFVRYYSYAPALLNSVVVMAALVCVASPDWIRIRGARIRTQLTPLTNRLLLLGMCSAVALVMHRQEAVFIGVVLIALVVWLLCRRLAEWLQKRGPGRVTSWAIVAVMVLAAGMILFWINTRVYQQASIPQSGSGKVVALPFAWPGFGPLHILNPKFQFAQVVTLWGAVVIAGFVIGFRFFREQPLLVAGMLTPLITVFNPLFVDLFLRVEDDHSLWRLCLVLPLYAVAGLLVVRGVSTWKRRSGLVRLGSTLLIASLLTLPFASSINGHVRSTNLPVASTNSYHLWLDALEHLASLPGSERILTDPVTGYLISGLTAHRTFRYKFLASDLYQAFPFAFDDYTDAPLSRYRGWLILVNLRDGSPSRTGQVSRHWPEDIMRVSQYYPQALRRHLAQHPQRFAKLWSADDMTLYRVVQ